MSSGSSRQSITPFRGFGSRRISRTSATSRWMPGLTAQRLNPISEPSSTSGPPRVSRANAVRDVADGVFGVADQYNGFVVSSNVTSGRGSTPVPLERGDTGQRTSGAGTIELRIPAAHLQDALGDLSKLAHVTSRTDGTV